MEDPSLTECESNAILPSIVDLRARSHPDRLYGASTWIGADDKLKLRRITYRNLSDAVNLCSQWLETRFGKSEDYTTLAYAGPNDYRYLIVTMAAAKTGHKALLLAPWNSSLAQIKLLDACNCSIFLAAEDSSAVQNEVTSITAQRMMEVHKFPTLNWLLDEGPKAPFYPFRKTLEELRDQDYVIIHTSGSTGHPSPMFYKYGAIAALKHLSAPEKFTPGAPAGNIAEVWSNKCHWMALPPCHMGGVLGLGAFNIYWNMPMILSPGDRPITPDIAAQIFAQDICEAAFMPPAYLHSLSRRPEHLEAIRKLKHVLWVGAPWTSFETANAFQARVEIQAAYGSSEAGPFVLIVEEQDDYAWKHFHPIMGASFQHASKDLYELVLEKQPEIQEAQFVFQNFPHLTEYRTKDLFSKHPTRDDLWRFRGRTDDIIVLSNGRLIEPALMESSVAAHANVRAALLCSDGKSKVGLLVEAVVPPTSTEESAALVEEIWPVVVSSNAVMNVFGRVDKALILFATKDKPFSRAGKGSVLGPLTLKAYDQEMKDLFRAAEEDS
ncbi:Non-canonical non-ribosomal peptide synthetase [Lachnellula subtilissima]|uniref:Non-canonical non-ribosomal peptide synthetase n=1 Tax=Lachnellula subtilissima TaxID=602034 RepID=A0A8H8RRG5_9HELO|nr:Non-canonical non-ribosomal peptide synthetase [Lachnellula subtilissima]